MFSKCNKFWLYDPKQLFINSDLIPLDNMSFDEQMNSVTRLVLIIYIVMGLMEYKNSIQFFISSLLLIILIFLINKEMTKQKENFSISEMNNTINRLYTSPKAGIWASKPESVETARFADNQSLVGSASPKTLIPPIIPPPLNDDRYWRPNDFVGRPEINTTGRRILKQSGYMIPQNCDKNFQLPNPLIQRPKKLKYIREPDNADWKGYTDTDFEECCSKKNNSQVFNINTLKNTKNHEIRMCNSDKQSMKKYMDASGSRSNLQDLIKPKSKEEFMHENELIKLNGTKCSKKPEEDIQVKYGIPIQISQPQDGDMIDGCGYNPRKSIYGNLRSNEPSGVCQEFPTLTGYNESLNTQIIQPGVYSKSQIMEPQMSNLGISHTQQFQPVNVEIDQFGNKIFVQQDPRINSSKNMNIVTETPSPNYSNVFDPRSHGYGPQNRMYIDPATGRPRFYYDDIDAARQGNFIIKSNVDSLPFTDHYGTMRTDDERKNYLENHRELVLNDYTNAMIKNRTETQERLMRKMNEKTVQQRKAPIHTRNNASTSGVRC